MKTLALTLVATLLGASAMAQYKLEYKSSGSMPLHYKAHTTIETTQTAMGQTSTFSMSSDQSISMTSAKSDADLVFSMIVDSSENLMIMPNGDTNRTPSPMVGKMKETRIHRDGEEVYTRWLDTAFANTDAAKMKQAGDFFFKLPAGTVNSGATWHEDKTDTAEVGGQGKIYINTGTAYKLIGEEKADGISCARIEFTGKVSMNGAANIQGMDMAITGKGTITGYALFDYGAGKVVNVSGSSDQDLTMASSGDNPMTIPMTQKADYQLTLVK